MCSLKSNSAMVAILVMAPGLLSATPANAQTFKCLPSCSSHDARFLAIANGPGFVTLSEPALDLEIAVPSGAQSFTVGVFDGDARAGGSAGHWDSGSDSALYTYTLYADPRRDNSTSLVVNLLPGLPSIPSTSMPDNAWIDFTVNTSLAARSPGGNYYYLLRIQLQSLTLATLNAFKVRTGGAQVGGCSIFPLNKPFSYIAALTSLTTDAPIVYPNFPATTPTFYDGFFSFYFDEAVSQRDIAIWEGDFDHGKFDGTEKDTDDPDTPNLPLPPWATLDTLPEGIAVGLGASTGNPADDRNPAGTGNIYLLKPPSIRYDVIFPDGRTFANDNPSGNQEWEQFKISTDPFDRNQMDYNTASPIPPGIYQMRIQGLDMANLNALLLPGNVLCVDDMGMPCRPLRPFLAGGTVFLDLNADGVRESPAEPGIPNLVVDLLDQSGELVDTAVTDAGGRYAFEVEALLYTVRLASPGSNPTTPSQCPAAIIDNNLLSCNFGFRPGTLGGRVWNDLNGNGVQDLGEVGLNGVTVRLFGSTGNLVATTATSGNGNYIFPILVDDTYTVQIDRTTLPRYMETYDLDGLSTPDAASLHVSAGGRVTKVDFGYRRGLQALGELRRFSNSLRCMFLTLS